MLSGDAAPDLLSPFDTIVFPESGTVVAAVSGGSDSTALLALLSDYLKHRSSCRLVAVTIDHGLRAESAAEARAVGALCDRLGVTHLVRRWTGPKPATGLAAAARDSRYRLLHDAACAVGATMILTGHTADDQAETVAMRAARGTGRGLAGMASATLLDGDVWLMRPFLGVRREALRDRLRDQGIGWIEDPSNENAASERVRTRQAMAAGDVEHWLAVAEAAASEREAMGAAAARLIEAFATMPAPGLVRIERGLFGDRAEMFYALRILLAVVGGRSELPEETAALALLDTVAGGPHRATLSGCVVDARRDAVWLYRERRGLPSSMLATADTVWDGRFRLQCQVFLTSDYTIAPLGREGAKAVKGEACAVPPALARAAAAARPALWRGASLIGPVGGEPVRAEPVAAPWARFLPAFDLEPARAIAALIGASSPPAPPQPRHTAGRP